MVKGVLHPADAERLVALGADGLIVSNHGGRHFDGAPASIDILPAIVSAVGSRATVMVDSGIRSGLDMCARAGARRQMHASPAGRISTPWGLWEKMARDMSLKCFLTS